MIAFLAAIRIQFQLAARTPTVFMVLFTIPPYTILFVSIMEEAGREDLLGHAVMAPVLIALWGMAIWTSGSIVRGDRWLGTLEMSVAAPSLYALAVVGRILAVTLISLLAFAEAWLTAWAAFGLALPIHHPTLFAATLVASVVAMAGTAVAMAALFVLSRVANTFQSSVSYPFYVLGGVIVPIALLPEWVQPLSRVVFLSWSADLLRDSLAAGPVTDPILRVGMILLLAAAGFGVGWYLLERVLHRVRVTGTISHA